VVQQGQTQLVPQSAAMIIKLTEVDVCFIHAPVKEVQDAVLLQVNIALVR